jgi:hypothetical protein
MKVSFQLTVCCLGWIGTDFVVLERRYQLLCVCVNIYIYNIYIYGVPPDDGL